MKKIFLILAILFTLTSIGFADEMIGDCESIEMECIGTSLWCEAGEVI